MSVLHQRDATDIQLVGIAGDCDEQAEARANRERRVGLSLFSAPRSMLEGIGNHITRVTVIPWVNVESNVCIAM